MIEVLEDLISYFSHKYILKGNAYRFSHLHGHQEHSMSLIPLSPMAEEHHPPPHCAYIHCLVFINIKHMSVKVSGYRFFSTGRNSTTHLCFMSTSTSDAILSDRPSAAICHTTTKIYENVGGKAQPILPYHHHLPLMSRANIKLEALLSEQPSRNYLKITVLQ